jgi:hypothetical protein
MWTKIMDRIERDNETSPIKVSFDRESLLSFAERHYHRRERSDSTWNGRQIRNAFQIALAMGHSQRLNMLARKGIKPEEATSSRKKALMVAKLTKTNMQNIAQTTRAFEDYIQHLRGNDSDLARQTEVREDHFDPAAPLAMKDYESVGAAINTRHGGDNFGPIRSTGTKVGATTGRSRQTSLRKTHALSDEEDEEDEGTDESDSEDDVDAE